MEKVTMKKTVFLFSLFFILLAGHLHAFCFEEAGSIYNVSPLLLWAITKVESSFRPDALNRNEDGS